MVHVCVRRYVGNDQGKHVTVHSAAREKTEGEVKQTDRRAGAAAGASACVRYMGVNVGRSLGGRKSEKARGDGVTSKPECALC